MNHSPPPHCISLLPQTSPLPHAFHWICSPSASFTLDQAPSNLHITSGLGICLTPEYDRIATASWQCPYCPPFHPSSWLLPLHLPKHSVALSTNALPRICPSFQGRQMPPSSSRTPDPPFRSYFHASETPSLFVTLLLSL